MLSGCAWDGTKPNTQVLPDVVQYPKEVQQAAYREAVGGSCPVLATIFMPDYGVMRDQARAAYSLIK